MSQNVADFLVSPVHQFQSLTGTQYRTERPVSTAHRRRVPVIMISVS